MNRNFEVIGKTFEEDAVAGLNVKQGKLASPEPYDDAEVNAFRDRLKGYTCQSGTSMSNAIRRRYREASTMCAFSTGTMAISSDHNGWSKLPSG